MRLLLLIFVLLSAVADARVNAVWASSARRNITELKQLLDSDATVDVDQFSVRVPSLVPQVHLRTRCIVLLFGSGSTPGFLQPNAKPHRSHNEPSQKTTDSLEQLSDHSPSVRSNLAVQKQGLAGLHYACMHGDQDIAQLLLKHKSNPNIM